MATLLLDSSNTSLSVGFENNGVLIGFTSYEAWQVQSEHMVPEIDKLMEKLGLSRKDITKVVTSIGPGSYTGVRIALTIHLESLKITTNHLSVSLTREVIEAILVFIRVMKLSLVTRLKLTTKLKNISLITKITQFVVMQDILDTIIMTPTFVNKWCPY